MLISGNRIVELKRFIANVDLKEENLYLHVEGNGVYLCSFHKSHVYLSYLKLGESDEFSEDLEFYTNYRDLKKFISKIKKSDEVDLISDDESEFKRNVVFRHRDWSKGNAWNVYEILCDKTETNLNKEHFEQFKTGESITLDKDCFKILHIYKKHHAYIKLYDGVLSFKFFKNKKLNLTEKVHGEKLPIIAKHQVCTGVSAKQEFKGCFNCEYLLQVLKKTTRDELTVNTVDENPLFIETDDYTGLLAHVLKAEWEFGGVLNE